MSAVMMTPRLLPPTGEAPRDVRVHAQVHGPLPYQGRPGALVPLVAAGGLTGRGGAAFPTARKLAAVAAAASKARRQPIVVGNGAESEPASQKDKTLLRTNPHLVLDGLQLAAEAVDAAAVYLYVHPHPGLRAWLSAALAERAAAGIDHRQVRLVSAPPRFLAGEESALVGRIGGGPALPRFTPPRVFERGVDGVPTLVQNVETLAQLALLTRYGPGWFRAAGTAEEPGSMLTTCWRVDGSVDVVETSIGSPLSSLLRLAELPAQAVLVGGYHGAWLPVQPARELRLANAELRPLGAALGAGVFAALPPQRCGLVESARVVRYLAAESAGQCGPCLNGLPRIAQALAALAAPQPAATAAADLHRWAGLVEHRGACHHPDGTVRFLRSTLRVFAEEVTRHAHGWCAATSTEPFLPIPPSEPHDDSEWS